MKSLALFPLLTLAALSQADIKAELDASNKKLDQAFRAKDLKKIEDLMKATVTSNFKYVEAGKTQDFKTFIGNLKASIAMMEKITSSTSRVLALKQTGDKASGKVEHTIVSTMKTPDKKTHATTWTGTFTEEYRKVGGKWKTSKIVPISQKYLVDGKPAKW